MTILKLCNTFKEIADTDKINIHASFIYKDRPRGRPELTKQAPKMRDTNGGFYDEGTNPGFYDEGDTPRFLR